MTRYYYTCPIKAAYMAKYYGMRFVDCSKEYDISDFVRLDYGDVYDDLDEKFYIHPDSLHLLEPVAGDLLIGPNNKVAMFYMGDTEPSDKCKIILRNGMVFMWPEELMGESDNA